jgi:rhamnosyl/mannosyltransferase
MACGLPLLSTALPTGVSDVNRDGVTGLVVPPGDAGALRDALVSLMADRERREAFGAAGRVVFEREYTAALMVERYLSLYREALG